MRIQAKIIQNAAAEFLEEIVISTNNQNPMKPRNLKSNTGEQRHLQREFSELQPHRWFYIRKDGEFQALTTAGRKVAWFHREHYKVDSGSRCRLLDNVVAAKSWCSWIGGSNLVLQGGRDFFGDDVLYERVFKKRPGQDYWDKFASPQLQDLGSMPFESDSPTAHQFLLASAAAAYLRATGTSAHKNRRQSLVRGMQEGKLQGNLETGQVTSSSSDQAAYLAGDSEYVLTNYLNNMEDVLVELFSFTLARAYGALDTSTARRLLRLPDWEVWSGSGFTASPDAIAAAHPDGVLVRTVEFVRRIARGYCTKNKYEIEASARSKTFFGRRPTINGMRAELIEADELTRDVQFPWKTALGKSFLKTLPPLEA